MDYLFFPAVVQGLLKLTLALTAVVAVRLTLLWMDRKLKARPFQAALREASANVQVGYFAVRLLAFCILVGLVLS